jgi:WD40 repeat protein
LRVAAAGKDKQVRVWRIGEVKADLAAELEGEVLRVAWSSDGTRLAAASTDGVVKMYRVSDWRELASWPGQSDQVFGLEFTHDGRALAIARRDGTFERRPIVGLPSNDAAPAVYSKREYEVRN